MCVKYVASLQVRSPPMTDWFTIELDCYLCLITSNTSNVAVSWYQPLDPAGNYIKKHFNVCCIASCSWRLSLYWITKFRYRNVQQNRFNPKGISKKHEPKYMWVQMTQPLNSAIEALVAMSHTLCKLSIITCSYTCVKLISGLAQLCKTNHMRILYISG